MADLNINLYALLGIVEILLILMMLGGVLFFQLRSSRRDAASLREQLQRASTDVHREVVEVVKVAEPAEPQRDYADFLRDELARSNQLLGEDPRSQSENAPDTSQNDADALARQMLAARHQFLQLELDVQGIASTADIEAQRQSVITGMQALLDSLRPQTAGLPEEPPMPASEEARDEPLVRSEVNRLQDQIIHLRTVIDNQHSVMRELRHLLEEHGGESEELHEALRKLGDAEAQAVELQRCLEVMEHENERLKHAPTPGTGSAGGAGPDADMLRDLVGSQQRTISKLQHMLQSLAPDSGKAKELGDAIGKIQRANSELNSCVMVLEDENAMLRGQVESLQERIADLEAHAVHEEDSPGADAEGADNIDALWETAFAEQASGDSSGGPSQETQDSTVLETQAEKQVAAALPASTPASAADDQPLETEDLLAELFGTSQDDTSNSKAG